MFTVVTEVCTVMYWTKKTGACAGDTVEPLTARSNNRNAPVSVEEAADVYGQPPVVADCGPRVGEQRSTPKSKAANCDPQVGETHSTPRS